MGWYWNPAPVHSCLSCGHVAMRPINEAGEVWTTPLTSTWLSYRMCVNKCDFKNTMRCYVCYVMAKFGGNLLLTRLSAEGRWWPFAECQRPVGGARGGHSILPAFSLKSSLLPSTQQKDFKTSSFKEDDQVTKVWFYQLKHITMNSPHQRFRRIVGQPPSAVGVLRFPICRDKSAKRSSSCQVH